VDMDIFAPENRVYNSDIETYQEQIMETLQQEENLVGTSQFDQDDETIDVPTGSDMGTTAHQLMSLETSKIKIGTWEGSSTESITLIFKISFTQKFFQLNMAKKISPTNTETKCMRWDFTFLEAVNVNNRKILFTVMRPPLFLEGRLSKKKVVTFNKKK